MRLHLNAIARVALAGAVLTALASGCDVTRGEYFGRTEKRSDTSVLYYGNSAEPEFMDPARMTATNDIRVGDQCFDGLTEIHPKTAKPIAALAETWQHSDDWLHFTYQMRESAKFSDGRKLDAHDVLYSWARMLHPIWAARDAEEGYKIEGAEEYNSGKLKELLAPAGKLAPGAVKIVDQVFPKKSAEQKEKDGLDDTNLRRPKQRVELRADPRDDAPVLHRYGTDAELTIFDVTPDRQWAHVWETVSLKGGWVKTDLLRAPNDDAIYLIEGLKGAQANVRAFARGKDLLAHPRLLAIRVEDGGKSLKVDLGKPTLYWETQTANATFRIVDRYSLDRFGKSWHRQGGKFACSGAFCMTAWHLRNRLELVKNPHYWGAKDVKLERIKMFSIDSQSSAINLYFAGKVDALTSNAIPASILPALRGVLDGKPKKDYRPMPLLGTYFYIFNVHKDKGPAALKNKHLRRALALALDREQLTKVLNNGAIPWAANVPTGLEEAVGYKSPKGLWFDLDAAKKELALARADLGSIPRMTIRINTGVETHQIIAEWVQAQWKTLLGLDIAIESQEWGTMLKSLRAHEFEIMRMGGVASMPEPEDFVGDSYRKGSPNNRPGWDSDEYMALLDKMQKEPDRTKRNQLIYQMETMVLEEAVIVPFYTYAQQHLKKPYVCGMPYNVLDQVALKYVWLDFSEKCEAPSPLAVLDAEEVN